MNIIKLSKNYIKKYIKALRFWDKNVYLSFGENCLTDDILERYNLKNFSTPYSSGRTNIEYIIKFEEEDFRDLLNPDYLEYGYLNEKKVVRNTKYVSTENKYEQTCVNGFEFTHHDVIAKNNSRKKIWKRCCRLKELNNKKLTILYHHRMCSDTDEELLVSHLLKLIEIYKKRNNDVNIYAFSQIIVSEPFERKIEHSIKNGINMYTLYTLNKWEGCNQDIFWARCDDDLISVIINDIKKCR